jgi:chromosomal replication initiation ATPase DnaA
MVDVNDVFSSVIKTQRQFKKEQERLRKEFKKKETEAEDEFFKKQESIIHHMNSLAKKMSEVKEGFYDLKPVDIVTEIQDYFGLDITTKTRKKEYIEARILASYFLKTFTRLSLNSIAEYVGVGDHTTVIHHVKTVRNHIKTEPDFYKTFLIIESRLKNKQINGDKNNSI